LDGRETIDPASFQLIEHPNYPIWRWFIAPIEVLSSDSGLTVIVIIVVLFFAGGAFAVLDETGTLRAFIGRIVRRFSALAANLIGALAGALLQSITFITGIKALLLVVAGFHLLSMLTAPDPSGQRARMIKGFAEIR